RPTRNLAARVVSRGSGLPPSLARRANERDVSPTRQRGRYSQVNVTVNCRLVVDVPSDATTVTCNEPVKFPGGDSVNTLPLTEAWAAGAAALYSSAGLA